jgi:hypothetical protein
MSNTSDTRFRNTLTDLKDCYEAMDEDEDLDPEERARKQLIKLCVEIAENYGNKVEESS